MITGRQSLFLNLNRIHKLMLAPDSIRWAIHLNVTVIPRSRDPRHILLNFKALDIELSTDEIKLITEEWLPNSSGTAEEKGKEWESPETDEVELGDSEELEDTGKENDGSDNIVTGGENRDEL